MGFWGINSSDYVSFEGIPETPGMDYFANLIDVDSGARSLQQFASCPKFSEDAETPRRKV
jgi:hypothetical protein